MQVLEKEKQIKSLKRFSEHISNILLFLIKNKELNKKQAQEY